MIIEVKSNAEYKSKKTIDKTKGVKNNGYKFLLVGRKEIKLLEDDKQNLIRLIYQNEKTKN